MRHFLEGRRKLQSWAKADAHNRDALNIFVQSINELKRLPEEQLLEQLKGQLSELKLSGRSAKFEFAGYPIEVKPHTVEDEYRSFRGGLTFHMGDVEEPFFVVWLDQDGYWRVAKDGAPEYGALAEYTGGEGARQSSAALLTYAMLALAAATSRKSVDWPDQKPLDL